MARTRRQKLARVLVDATDLTYQQALVWLDGYCAATGRLPRTEDELWRARSVVPAPAEEPAPEFNTAELVNVADVRAVRSFTMNYSSLSRCPHMVMTVDHWLPTDECAHMAPTCPTCQGQGMLATTSGVVTCDRGVGLPTGAPVCAGTGIWTGDRA